MPVICDLNTSKTLAASLVCRLTALSDQRQNSVNASCDQEVSELSIPVAKLYATVADKTIQRDLEKLIELELVKKENSYYKANIGQLRSMIAKRRRI